MKNTRESEILEFYNLGKTNSEILNLVKINFLNNYLSNP